MGSTLLIVGLVACDEGRPAAYGDPDPDAPVGDGDEEPLPGDADDGAARQGRRVYVMTNAAAGNEIVGLEHDADDQLFELGRFATEGLGTGEEGLAPSSVDPLGAQGALHRIGDHLLAVNAGSGSVTVFRAEADGALVVTDVQHTGAHPVTIASLEDRVFVGLCPGPDGEGGVASFRYGRGELTPDGALLPLATAISRPGDLVVSDDGRFLVASEPLDDAIAVWPLREDGVPGEVVRTPSAGAGPLGMDLLGVRLIVAEAAPTASSLSSYQVEDDGVLTPISPAVPSRQRGGGRLQVTPDGGHAVVANTDSDTLSTWKLRADASVALLQGAGRRPGDAPNDLSISADGRYLYVLLGGTGQLAVYRLTDRIRRVGQAVDLDLPERGAQGVLSW